MPIKSALHKDAEPLPELEVVMRENEKLKRNLLAHKEAKKESKRQARVSLHFFVFNDILDDIV